MDGVAVRAADTGTASGATPLELKLDGRVLAGQDAGPALPAGSAREIATGATLPPGADAVVRIEDVTRDGDRVVLTAPVDPGKDVRPVGEDAAAGTVLAHRGRRVTVNVLAGLAGAGIDEVVVRRRPRVTLLPTGDEVAAGTTPDALGPALHRLYTVDGAVVEVASPVRDDLGALVGAITTAAAVSDLVVTTGGVGAGPADLARRALESAGAGQGASLALHPGRPFAWGRVLGVPVVCLPGNPTAAVATSLVLVRPLLATLLDGPEPQPARRCLGADVQSHTGTRDLVPVRHDGPNRVVPVLGNGSADLRRLAACDGLADLPGDGTGREGDPVDVWLLP
jgi:molybdopterin molybdotransferase